MKKLKTLTFTALAIAALFTLTLPARADGIEVTTSGGFTPIVSATETATLVVDEADASVVPIVAEAVASDIEAITGKRPAVGTTLTDGPLIIAGTLGQNDIIDALVESALLTLGNCAPGKWETYALQTVGNITATSSRTGKSYHLDRALVIVGSTPRGTAYGLFELSRLMGVSPWIWWADVTPEARETLYLSEGQMSVDEPSVKYRGFFINDEDWGLQPWAARMMDTDVRDLGPNTYAKVFELALRLRANLVWPGMHPCTKAFWYYKDNVAAAQRYHIVLGSSHCEALLRNNVFEWSVNYKNEFGEAPGDYNYATNAAQVQKYWARRVGESRGHEAIYTIGMRGVHDGQLVGYNSVTDKVRGLTDIIAFQRQLLTDSLGDCTKVPQLFIPYKEVLDAYNAGLQVPEDVTLCWVDDNHGYIRQLSNTAEQQRSGGAGLYYHVSYWGSPQDYLWLCSTSPSLISFELTKAYEMNTRNQWIINVGDIKPAEEVLEFCMDLGWNIDQWSPEQAHNYSRAWAARTFGEEFADEIGAIKEEYYRLAASGKPEHVAFVSYTNAEMDQRIADYKALYDRVTAVKSLIPARLSDAFFELVEYPVNGAYRMNVKILRAAQSFIYAKAGDKETALAYASESKAAYNNIQRQTTRYNQTIAGGKWHDIMSAAPRSQSQFNQPAVATAADVSAVQTDIVEPEMVKLSATAYTSASPTVKALNGLGISAQSIGVWPLSTATYADGNTTSAPYAEYDLPVKAGQNTIEVCCLPTFPLNKDYKLRYGLSVDGGEPTLTSIQTTATSSQWDVNVLRGYASGTTLYESTEDKTIKLRVYFTDPGLVVSEIRNTIEVKAIDGGTETENMTGWIVNPGFDDQYTGWTITAKTQKISTVEKGGGFIAGGQNHLQLWNSSGVKGKLSQTIAGLPAGKYTVRVDVSTTNFGGTATLFANTTTATLQPNANTTYEVTTELAEGEALELGINFNTTGNIAFDIDNFQLLRIVGTDPNAIDVIGTDASLPAAGQPIYNLQGQRVGTTGQGQPQLPRSIYVVGRKKYMIF